MFRGALIGAAMALLAGCGFQPLYAERPETAVVSQLGAISIPPIPERVGQLLRIELSNQLSPHGAPERPTYVLAVNLTETKQDLAIRKDATATRANLLFAASFNLRSVPDGDSVLAGTVRSIASYNILASDFATLTAEADARRRAARDLANEIASRIGVFLARPTARRD